MMVVLLELIIGINSNTTLSHNERLGIYYPTFFVLSMCLIKTTDINIYEQPEKSFKTTITMEA